MMIVSFLCSLSLVSSMSVVESVSFPRLPFVHKQGRRANTVEIDEKTDTIAIEERWTHLMESCLGNFSGSIGWYDVHHNSSDTDEQQKSVQFTSRPDNGQRNMRLSFLLRPEDPMVGDWVVHHAYHEGSRDAVVVQKMPTPKAANDPFRQTFYSYSEGIIGRSGANMKTFPVIEHGFWDLEEKMRRTAVLVYNSKSLQLEKVCFLQQARRTHSDFNASVVELDDTAVLPKDMFLHNPTQRMASFEHINIFNQWKVRKLVVERSETLDNEGGNRTVECKTNKLDDHDVMKRLFGLGNDGNIVDADDGTLRYSLPNGIFVAAPQELQGIKNLCFSFAYRRTNEQVQVLEISCNPSDGSVEKVRAAWYRPAA